MEITRGDVVLCVAPGDYSKPRPAVVVQSDLFNPTHASFTLCPITSERIAAPLFRLTVRPTAQNGLKKPSQIMVDKLTTQPAKRLGKVVGRLTAQQLAVLDEALRLWLGLSA